MGFIPERLMMMMVVIDSERVALYIYIYIYCWTALWHLAMRDVKDMGQQMGYRSLEWNGRKKP